MDRKERRRSLLGALAAEPLLTDRELADRLGVSVQTIRLDRMSLGIPEVRARAMEAAERALSPHVGRGEVVGEIIDLVEGEAALSRLVTEPEMAYGEKWVHSHLLFAQAETLAMEIVPEGGSIGLGRVKFRRPVRVGEVLVAKAQVIRRPRGRFVVLATIRSGQDEVFRGKFVIAPPDEEGVG